MKKLLSSLTSLLIIFSSIAPVLTSAQTDPLDALRDQSVAVLDSIEAVANKTFDRVETTTTSAEIEASIAVKEQEVQEYIAQVQEEIEEVDSKKEIKEILEEVKKVVTLKIVSGTTDYDNVASEITSNITGTQSEKADAVEVVLDSLTDTKNDVYSLMIKTSMTYEKALSTLVVFDPAIVLFELFSEDGINYFEASIDTDSLLSREMLPDIEAGIIPDKLMGIEVIKPEALKIGETPQETLQKEDITSTWGIQFFGAQSYFTGLNRSVVSVAVVDTGITSSHPDLQTNIDTSRAYDFINNDTDPSDDQGHGTHVSGTISAALNGTGIIGVYPFAQIVPLKICDASGFCPSYAVYQALSYAIEKNIDVINMSLGGAGNPATSSICQAIDAATKAGIIVVSAAGNANRDTKTFVPGGCSSAITVAAIDKTGARANFSNYGTGVDISAPGVGIYSTYLNNGYKTLDGTSMAAPHIAGLAALIRSQKPGISGDQALALMKQFPRATTSDSAKIIAPSIDVPKLIESMGISAQGGGVGAGGYVFDYANLAIDPTDGTLYDPNYEIQLSDDFYQGDGVSISNFGTTTSATMILGEPAVGFKSNGQGLSSRGYELIPDDTSVATGFYDNNTKKFTIQPRGLGKTLVRIHEFQTRKQVGLFDITVVNPTPQSIKISPNPVTVDADPLVVNLNIATATGGSGIYKIDGLTENSIATAHIEGKNISVRGKAGGTASFKIVDTKNSSLTAYLSVSVRYPTTSVTVNPGSVSVLPDGIANVVAYATGGSGKGYTISGGGAEMATGHVAANGQITIRGIALGTTGFVITDSDNGTTANLRVSVTTTKTAILFDRSSVSMDVGANTSVYITSGHSPYTVKSNQPHIATATLNGLNRIAISGKAIGTATIVVFDAKGSTAQFTVTVGSSEKELVLGQSSIVFTEGTTATVQIVSGNAPYKARSNDVSISDATISGNTITLSGYKPDTTTVFISDALGKVANLSVRVNKFIRNLVLEKNFIALNVNATATVNILDGNGGYTLSNQTPALATATLSGTTLTIKGIVKGTAMINLRDAQGQSTTLTVSVGEMAITNVKTLRWSPDQTTIIYTINLLPTAFIETGLEYSLGGKTYRYPVSSINSVSQEYRFFVKNLESRVQPYYIDKAGKYIVANPSSPQIITSATPPKIASAGEYSEEEILVEEKPFDFTLRDEFGNPMIFTSEESSETEVAPSLINEIKEEPTESSEESSETVEINAAVVAPDQKIIPEITTLNSDVSITLEKGAKTTVQLASPMYLQYRSGDKMGKPLTGDANGISTFQGILAGRYVYSAFTGGTQNTFLNYVVIDVYDPLVLTNQMVTLQANNQLVYNVSTISGGMGGGFGIRGGHTSIATGTLNGNQITLRGIGSGVTKFWIYSMMNPTIEKELIVAVGATKNLTLSTSSTTTKVGSTVPVTITSGNGGYTAKSLDTRIATVSVDGDIVTLTGKMIGSTSITVTDSLGKTATIYVTITGSDTLSLSTGSVSTTINTMIPVTITSGNGGYTVSSSNTNIATVTVEDATLIVTGKNTGTATITVRDVANKSATLTVKIGDLIRELVVTTAPIDISSGVTRIVSIIDGNGGYAVTSSDPTIAVASIVGRTLSINGISGGVSTLTVTDSKNQTATVEVMVNGGVRPLVIDKKAYNLMRNTSFQVKIINGNGGYTAQTAYKPTPIISSVINGNTITVNGLNSGKATLIVTDSKNQTVEVQIVVTDEVSPTAITYINTTKWSEEQSSIYFGLNGTKNGYIEVGLEYQDETGNVYRTSFPKIDTNNYHASIKEFTGKVQPYFIDMNGNYYVQNPGKPTITISTAQSVQTASAEGEISEEVIEDIDPTLLLDEAGNPIIPPATETESIATEETGLIDMSQENQEIEGEVKINSAMTIPELKSLAKVTPGSTITGLLAVGKTVNTTVFGGAQLELVSGNSYSNPRTYTLGTLNTFQGLIGGEGLYQYKLYNSVFGQKTEVNQLYLYVYSPIKSNPETITLKQSTSQMKVADISGGTTTYGNYRIASYGSNPNILYRTSINGRELRLAPQGEGETTLTIEDVQYPAIKKYLKIKVVSQIVPETAKIDIVDYSDKLQNYGATTIYFKVSGTYKEVGLEYTHQGVIKKHPIKQRSDGVYIMLADNVETKNLTPYVIDDYDKKIFIKEPSKLITTTINTRGGVGLATDEYYANEGVQISASSSSHEILWSKDIFGIEDATGYTQGEQVQISGLLLDAFIDLQEKGVIPKNIISQDVQAGTTNWNIFVTNIENLKANKENVFSFVNLAWFSIADEGLQSLLVKFVAIDAVGTYAIDAAYGIGSLVVRNSRYMIPVLGLKYQYDDVIVMYQNRGKIIENTLNALKGRAFAIMQIDQDNYLTIYNGYDAIYTTGLDVCSILCAAGAGGLAVRGSQAERIVAKTSSEVGLITAKAQISSAIERLYFMKLVEMQTKASKINSIETLLSVSDELKIVAASPTSNTTRVVVGTYDDAQKWINKVINENWTMVRDTPEIKAWKSLDRKYTVNLRTISSENLKPPFIDAQSNATIDIIEYNLATGQKLNEAEIKFGTLK